MSRAKTPLNLSVEATSPTLTFVDPKTGKMLWKSHSESTDAQSGATSSSVMGTMRGVSGVMFHNGAAADSVAADTVTADQASRVVTASGHVRLQSIGDKTTSVTCDQIVWHAATNVLIGTGHVVFKKGGFTQTAPSFRADTKMKTITMPAPGMGGGKVNATIHKMPV